MSLLLTTLRLRNSKESPILFLTIPGTAAITNTYSPIWYLSEILIFKESYPVLQLTHVLNLEAC